MFRSGKVPALLRGVGWVASPATFWHMQKLGLRGMSGWARPQYPPTSVRGGEWDTSGWATTTTRDPGLRGKFCRGLVQLQHPPVYMESWAEPGWTAELT